AANAHGPWLPGRPSTGTAGRACVADGSAEREDEVVLRPAVACLECHLAAAVAVGAGATGDRQDTVALVVVRALNRDLASAEERRPQALPDPLLDRDTRAEPLVVADLLRVRDVEDGVVEGQDVAVDILPAPGRDLVVGDRVLDHVNRRAGRVPTLRSRGARRCQYRRGRRRNK